MRKKKVFFIVLFFIALLGFAIYEEELEAQIDQQYRIESNVPEWDGQTAALKGTVDYNHLRIGGLDFSGTIWLGEHELNHVDQEGPWVSYREYLALSYPDERGVCVAVFGTDVGPGQDIPETLGVNHVWCGYDPDTREFLLSASSPEGEQLQYRLIPIQEEIT